MKLDSNYHSVFKLTYHLVLVVKYRRKVINDQVAARIRQIGEYIAPHYNITFLEYNHDRDQVHILFKRSSQKRIVQIYQRLQKRLVKVG